DGDRRKVTHRGLANLFVLGVPGVVKQKVRRASDGDVFVALRMRPVRTVGPRRSGDESDALLRASKGAAESTADELNGEFGFLQPLAIAGHAVEYQEGAGHGDGIAQKGPADVLGTVAESATRQAAMPGDPTGGADGLSQSVFFPGNPVQRRERGDGPAIFARVDVLVDARYATLAARGIVPREIFRAVLTGDEIRILTGVESAIRAGEKCAEICADRLRGLQVLRIVELRIALRVDAQILSLHGHDFLEVRVGPDAAGGILVDTAPDRVQKL